MKETEQIVAVDFDGVLHSYTSGWKGPRNIPDPPVNGAIEWLYLMMQSNKIKIAIFSSRSRYLGGRRAMKRWLRKHGLTKLALKKISFPTRKPPAFILIDDRAYTFKGKFPTEEFILDFKPWYK